MGMLKASDANRRLTGRWIAVAIGLALATVSGSWSQSAFGQSIALTALTTFGSNGWLSNTTLNGYAGNSNDQIRSIAFNPSTGNLLYATGTSVASLNATTGAFIGQLARGDIATGVGTVSAGASRTLSQVTVTTDGSIYGVNLTTSSTSTVPTQMYRWSSESGTAVRVYSGNAGYATGARVGDSLLAFGNDANGVLLFGTGTLAATPTVYFGRVPTTLTSGSLAIPTVMTGDGAANQGFRQGFIAVDADTVFGMSSGNVSTNLVVSGTSSPWTSDSTRTIQNGNERSISEVRWVGSTPVISTIQFGAAGINTVRLYNASSLFTSVSGSLPLLASAMIATGSTTNTNGAVGITYGELGGNLILYALNTNNGIQAFTIVPEPATWAMLATGVVASAGVYIRRHSRRRGRNRVDA